MFEPSSLHSRRTSRYLSILFHSLSRAISRVLLSADLARDPSIYAGRAWLGIPSRCIGGSLPILPRRADPFLPAWKPFSSLLELFDTHPKPRGLVVGGHQLHYRALLLLSLGDHNKVIISAVGLRRCPTGSYDSRSIHGVLVHESSSSNSSSTATTFATRAFRSTARRTDLRDLRLRLHRDGSIFARRDGTRRCVPSSTTKGGGELLPDRSLEKRSVPR